VDRIKEQSPGKNVAEISVEEVAASVKGTKVSQDALKRLVEQRKQHHLIDHHYFKEEVGQMIADYLQPLPRDAKRVLNRFRVNLLIAHSRQLLTTAPKVNTQQIGKWLVLDERWPQLSRSLCLHPEEMARLEEQSAPPARSARKPVNPDAFKELVKTLAPAYVDDDVLRTFVHSEPALAAILPRLVHYGVESQIKS
jgi:hypothetical protein